MNCFSLRLPEDLKGWTVAKAEALNFSLNQYTASRPGLRIVVQAETERSFTAHAAWANPNKTHDSRRWHTVQAACVVRWYDALRVSDSGPDIRGCGQDAVA